MRLPCFFYDEKTTHRVDKHTRLHTDRNRHMDIHLRPRARMDAGDARWFSYYENYKNRDDDDDVGPMRYDNVDINSIDWKNICEEHDESAGVVNNADDPSQNRDAYDVNEVVKRLRELGLTSPPIEEGVNDESSLLFTRNPLLGRCEKMTSTSTSTSKTTISSRECHVRWKSSAYAMVACKHGWLKEDCIPIFGYWGLCNMIQKFSSDVAFAPMVIESTFLSNHFPHIIPTSPIVVMFTRNETLPAFMSFTESLSHLKAICHAFESRVDTTKSPKYIKAVTALRFDDNLKIYRSYRSDIEALLEDARRLKIFSSNVGAGGNDDGDDDYDAMASCKKKLCLRFTIVSLLFQKQLIHSMEKTIAFLAVLTRDIPTLEEIIEVDNVFLTPIDPIVDVLMTYESETDGDPTIPPVREDATETPLDMTTMYVNALWSFFTKKEEEKEEKVDDTSAEWWEKAIPVAKLSLMREVKSHFEGTVENDYVRRMMLRCAMWGNSSNALFTMNFERWKKNVASLSCVTASNKTSPSRNPDEHLNKIAIICEINRANEWRDELSNRNVATENGDDDDEPMIAKESSLDGDEDDEFEGPKKKQNVSNARDEKESIAKAPHRGCRCIHDHVSLESLFCAMNASMAPPSFDSEGNNIDKNNGIPFGQVIWDAIGRKRVDGTTLNAMEKKDVVYDATVCYVEHMLCCFEGETTVFGIGNVIGNDERRDTLPFDQFTDACDIVWENITFDARSEGHHVPGVGFAPKKMSVKKH